MKFLKQALNLFLMVGLCYLFSKNAVKFLFAKPLVVDSLTDQVWFRIIAFLTMGVVLLFSYFMSRKKIGYGIPVIAFYFLCLIYAGLFERTGNTLFLLETGVRIFALSFITAVIITVAFYWLKKLDIALYGKEETLS